MFSELLSQFNQTLKQAKSSKKALQQTLKESRIEIGIQEEHQRNFHDPTQTYGKATSFAKSTRFKQLQRQQLKTTDVKQIQSILDGVKSCAFYKEQRFSKNKKEQAQTVINPNYDYTKKNNKKAAIIKQSALNEMEKSRVSQATMASISDEVGPGKYFIKQQTNTKKTCFSKGKRFLQKKSVNQDIPLYPKTTLTHKRPPSSLISKKQQKTKYLISKQQQQQMRQRLKMVYWQTIPLEIDRLFKNKVGPVMRQRYFSIKNLKGRQRRCAMNKLLKDFQMQRNGFEYHVTKTMKAPCGVAYRKSTPKPFKFSQMDPGPDFYYPQDDMTKQALIGYTFGKAQQKKQVQFDSRDYQISQQLFKKGGNIIINPEHTPQRLTQQQIRSLNRGPGYYDCLFSQVQKRNDIGVIKMVKLTEQNARENNTIQKKQVNDGIYYPSYAAIDPNVPTPIYKQPSNVHPQHLTDKQMFPQHWLFYDGDLNKVRAQIGKNVLLAKGMDYKQYKIYAEKFQAFQEYLNNRKTQPQVGKYDVKYTQIDKNIPNYQMIKQPQRDINCQGIVKQEGDVNGDNLLLQPEKLEKKLANINFSKMAGRQQNQLPKDQARDGDKLLLNPKLPEKKMPDIKFQKMIGREQVNDDPDYIPQGDRVIINPKQPQRHLPNIDFKKQVERPQFVKQRDQQASENILNPQLPVKKVKGFVEMGRMSSVKLIPNLRNKEKQNDQQIEQ